MYENTNDRWRALGYSKAIMAVKKYHKPITTFEVSYILIIMQSLFSSLIFFSLTYMHDYDFLGSQSSSRSRK